MSEHVGQQNYTENTQTSEGKNERRKSCKNPWLKSDGPLTRARRNARKRKSINKQERGDRESEDDDIKLNAVTQPCTTQGYGVSSSEVLKADAVLSFYGFRSSIITWDKSKAIVPAIGVWLRGRRIRPERTLCATLEQQFCGHNYGRLHQNVLLLLMDSYYTDG